MICASAIVEPELATILAQFIVGYALMNARHFADYVIIKS